MMKPGPGDSLASIAIAMPSTTRVFHDLDLDFCCGGQRTLADACASAGLTVDDVLARIAALNVPDTTDWSTAELPRLIDHILARFHEGHRRDLPELTAMAHKVESVHVDHPERPVGLAQHLEQMTVAMEEHMQKEETVLFPMIQAGHGRMAGMPVRVMMDEHEDHGRNLVRLRALAHDYQAPEGACTTWRALLERLRELELEVMEHVHLENNVLFPRALRDGMKAETV